MYVQGLILGGSKAESFGSLVIGVVLVIWGVVLLVFRVSKNKPFLERFYIPLFLIMFGGILCFIRPLDLRPGSDHKLSDRVLRDSIERNDVNEEVEKEGSMVLRRTDYLWLSCIIVAVGLFIVRKVVLALHGYGIGLIDYGFDRRRLNSIAEAKTLPKLRFVLKSVNILFPIFFFLGLFILVLSRVALS